MTNPSQLFTFLKKHHHATLTIVILALLVRLPMLTGSFWMDEAAQALESIRPLAQQLHIRDDFQPPLLHLLTHFALRISQEEWWLRWWGALLPALLSILLIPALSKHVLTVPNKPRSGDTALVVGWLAAFWLATNSFHAFFSQELRPYSLAAWWTVLSWLLLLRNSPRRWFIIASIAGLYSTYLYPFVLIGQFIYLLLWDRKPWLSHLATAALIILGFTPWLPSFFGQLQAGQQLRLDLPGWENVVSFSQLKVMPLVLGKWLFGARNLEMSAPWVGTLILVFALTTYCILMIWQEMQKNSKLTEQSRQLLRLVVGWGLIPLAIAWIVSFWVPVIQPKRVLWLWPLGALVFSWIIAASWRCKHKATRIAGIALASTLYLLNIIGLADYYQNPLLQRENWRGLQQQISAGYSPASTILVFGFPAPFASWQWYDQNRFPTINTGYLAEKSPDFTHALLNQVAEYRFVLVFDYLRTLTDPQNLILKDLEASGFVGVGVIDTPNIGFVRIYARPDSLLGATDPVHWTTSSMAMQGIQP